MPASPCTRSCLSLGLRCCASALAEDEALSAFVCLNSTCLLASQLTFLQRISAALGGGAQQPGLAAPAPRARRLGSPVSLTGVAGVRAGCGVASAAG